jgi:hypothetical protein
MKFYLRSIIMKKLMLMLVLVVVLSGCQTAPALFNDVAGSAAFVAEKLEPLAQTAKDRDAAISAKRLARRAAIIQALEDYAVKSGASHTRTVSNNEVR